MEENRMIPPCAGRRDDEGTVSRRTPEMAYKPAYKPASRPASRIDCRVSPVCGSERRILFGIG